jgi:resolvase-like protein
VDTTTPSGRLTISILAAIAEFERELIQARMAEGRKRAVKNGVRFGRPSKLDPRWPDIISRGLGSPSVGPHRHVLSWPSTSRGSPANSSDSEHFWFAPTTCGPPCGRLQVRKTERTGPWHGKSLGWQVLLQRQKRLSQKALFCDGHHVF